MLRKIGFIFVCSLLILLSQKGWAGEKNNDLYKVELIVFEDPAAQAIDSESWQRYPPLPSLTNTIKLRTYNPRQPLASFRMLPPEELTLNVEEKTLSKRYRILSHIAWLQSIKEGEKANGINIYTQRLNKDLLNQEVDELKLYLLIFF